MDPYSSWWPFAILIGGGVLVGLGQRLLGNYPESIETVVDKWKNHERVEPRTIPAGMVNSLLVLVAGGPVGFEAGLAGLLGGSATWIGDRIQAVRRVVRRAFGVDDDQSLPVALRQLPYWLAAVAGLITYRSLGASDRRRGYRASLHVLGVSGCRIWRSPDHNPNVVGSHPTSATNEAISQ